MANVDLSNCPHSGIFKAADSRCVHCAQSYECAWLNSTDEFNDLAEKSMAFLYRALSFGINYVETHKSVEEHNVECCECESCEWVKVARSLAREDNPRVTQIPATRIREKRT